MYTFFFNHRKIILAGDGEDFSSEEFLAVRYQSFAGLKNVVHNFVKEELLDNLVISSRNPTMLFHDFCAIFKCVTAAGGVVKNNNNDFLLIFRSGKWDLPKGMVEPGEATEQAAIREVEEETGLQGLIIRRTLPYTHHFYIINDNLVLKRTVWFEMYYNGDEIPVPQTAEDITDVVWLPGNIIDVSHQNTYPLILDVLASVGIKAN